MLNPASYFRRQFRSQPALTLLTAGSIVVICLATAAVVVENLFNPPDQTSPIREMEEPTPLETALLWFSQAMTTAGVFSIGASIGSFVNVLAYRMPAGKSVLKNRSACPNCEADIQGRDNIPILGWLQLNGRCRNCRSPISVQYPLVEFVGGLLLVILFFWQTLSGGWNIPVRNPNFYHGFVWIIFYTKWDLIGLLLLHSLLAYTLLAWWLIHFNRKKIPMFSLSWGLVIAGIATLIWPKLLPVPLFWPVEIPTFIPKQLIGLLSLMAGTFAGLVLGTIAAKLPGVSWSVVRQAQPLLFLPLIGGFLGWQAVTVIGTVWLILVLLLLIVSRLSRFHQPQTALLSITLLLLIAGTHHLFWRQICQLLDQFYSCISQKVSGYFLMLIDFSGLMIVRQGI